MEPLRTHFPHMVCVSQKEVERTGSCSLSSPLRNRKILHRRIKDGSAADPRDSHSCFAGSVGSACGIFLGGACLYGQKDEGDALYKIKSYKKRKVSGMTVCYFAAYGHFLRNIITYLLRI